MSSEVTLSGPASTGDSSRKYLYIRNRKQAFAIRWRLTTALLVSDGGISNNFPIQFFDSPLPSIERVVFERDFRTAMHWRLSSLIVGLGVKRIGISLYRVVEA